MDNPTANPAETPIPDGHKRCKDCGQVKPFAEFYKSAKGGKGYNNRCKPCASVYAGHKPKDPKPQPQYFPNYDLIKIPLTQGCFATIDWIDIDLADFDWYAVRTTGSDRFYARRVMSNRRFRSIALHQVIMERMLGRELLPEEKVDHINNDSLDNRRCNLRLASHAQNTRNAKRRKDNTSGFKGVSWHKGNQRWIARINVNGKRLTLGHFKTAEAAYEAYCSAAKEHYGEFARLE